MPPEPVAVRIRPAAPDEAALLSALALRSKAYWGYSPEFIEACHDELTWSPQELIDDDCTFRVAEVSGSVAGFYALRRCDAMTLELDALFVEPEHVGRGIGGSLLEDAKITAAARGGIKIVVQADPYAAEFYRAAGAVQTGLRESGSISGRYLPVFTLELREPAAERL